MNIGIISIFPKMFRAITDYGVTSRAIKNGLLKIRLWNLRSFANNDSIDDRPYGGGPGMLMMVQPLKEAIVAAKNHMVGTGTIKVIYFSPQGRKLTQQDIDSRFNSNSNLNLILICGRYEGVDIRLIDTEVDEELSIGDYVLSGGEIAAMVLIDAIARFIPGVLGHKDSAKYDSFAQGLLDYPNYTRPYRVSSMEVPKILLSGNHHKIHRWRLKQSLGITWLRRPDLLSSFPLTEDLLGLLNEFQNEYSST
ncbi:tRNA (guanosine(37)-N1)-methyltransferase TrmD [Candidatus Schneideria nysicola]|uniref:tRNA (guanosine(37)-N1)-methyltransferase TrmD n=1 Tax=Candidatus Schneideria nysicola TaxID=1081631 RepID=UPI001CAA6504|nr:tRNA (guanosine(37)-N1)-methyltransferase TrmD [Candidatus Schneideria nysicola]UAJ65806.1 tRNA (guanosine(37)-N1)-methyltransferase TrmD [Candidatus Schneideria nysicola]